MQASVVVNLIPYVTNPLPNKTHKLSRLFNISDITWESNKLVSFSDFMEKTKYKFIVSINVIIFPPHLHGLTYFYRLQKRSEIKQIKDCKFLFIKNYLTSGSQIFWNWIKKELKKSFQIVLLYSHLQNHPRALWCPLYLLLRSSVCNRNHRESHRHGEKPWKPVAHLSNTDSNT